MKKLRSLFAIVLAIAIICSFTVISVSAATTVNTEADLVTAVAAGGDIVLGANINLANKLTISKDVTLDLNGKTLSSSPAKDSPNDDPTVLITKGNVVIKDSQSNGTIQNTTEDSAVYIENGNVTINNGKFTNVEFPTIALENGSLTINDGNFSSTNGRAILNVGGILVINDGVFSSEESDVVYITNDCNEDGNSKTTINGGTFTTVAKQKGSKPAKAISCSAIVAINQDDDKAPATVEINGGSFSSKYFAAAAFNTNTTITGGEFKGLTAGAFFDYVVLSGGPNYKYNITGGYYESRAKTAADDDGYKFDILSLYSGIENFSAGIVTIENDIDKMVDDDCSIYINDKLDTIKTVDIYSIKAYYSSPIVAVEKTKGTAIEGADQTVQAGKDATIRSDINYRWFNDGTKQIGEVYVDDKLVDTKNYDASEGSTIIKFKSTYLETLSVGKHKVKIVSNVLGNKVLTETTLTVEDQKIVQTGDNNAIGAFAALGVISAAAFISLKKKEN